MLLVYSCLVWLLFIWLFFVLVNCLLVTWFGYGDCLIGCLVDSVCVCLWFVVYLLI